MEQLSERAIKQANDFAMFYTFQITWPIRQYLRIPMKTIALFAGNQSLKTSSTAYNYVLRILGHHPVADRNVLYFACSNGHKCNVTNFPQDQKCVKCGEKLTIQPRSSRIFRFASEVLPGDKETVGMDGQGQSKEIKNTQYPEFKKWLPRFLIKKDITFRNPSLAIIDPNGGRQFGDQFYKGEDIIIEFVSYNQAVQAGAGVQRLSVWMDEEPPYPFFEEQVPRLVKEHGDLILTLTPANRVCFDTETEIVTSRGWKRYDEILMSDRLLTYSIEKDGLEWKSLTGFNLFHYKGPMVEMKHQFFDALVTPNHKWVASTVRHPKIRYLEETQKLSPKNVILRMAKPLDSIPDNKEVSDNILALLGWIVSDGSLSGGHLCIYQSSTAYPEHCKKIRKLFDSFPESEYRIDEMDYGPRFIGDHWWDGSGRVVRFNITGELRRNLLHYLEGKSVRQDFVCSLSQRQISLLYNTIIDGDGYRIPNGAIRLKQINNEALLDSFQLMATLSGSLSTKKRVKYFRETSEKIQMGVNVFCDSERFWPNTHYKSLEIGEVDYNGMVWCPSTDNQTVVMRRNGCVSISGNSWTYDTFYERARLYVRTKPIVDFLATLGQHVQQIELTDSKHDIAVIQAATDDNPTMNPEAIEAMFDRLEDPDSQAIRRYGVHHQSSARIFKDFTYKIHRIDPIKYFPHGKMFKEWRHGLGIDYHPSNPWAITFVSLSPENEMFVWNELLGNPERYSAHELANQIAEKGDGYKFYLSLIDPLSNVNQPQTKTSVRDDLNNHFSLLQREGIIYGVMFECWETRGTLGRHEMVRRLKGSVECERPFNNKRDDNGRTVHVPTIWFFDNCVQTIRMVANWKKEEWGSSDAIVTKDAKETPQQRNSHFCTALEGFLKNSAWIPPRDRHPFHQINQWATSKMRRR